MAFQYGDIRIEGKRASVRDELHAQMIDSRLRAKAGIGEWGFWTLFSTLCTQTASVEGSLGFDPVDIWQADDATLFAGYEAFMDSDKALKDGWKQEVADANKPASPVLQRDAKQVDPNS